MTSPQKVSSFFKSIVKPANGRSRPAKGVIAIGIIGIFVLGPFFFLTRKEITGVDAVLNAQVVDIKAPEEGELQPLSKDQTDNLVGSQNNKKEDSCSSQQEGQESSLGNSDRLASDNQEIVLGQCLEQDSLLFRLKNERYSDLPIKLAEGRVREIKTELEGVRQQYETSLKLKSQVSIRSETQSDLEVLEQQALRRELERDLESVRERERLANVQLDRIHFLVKEGAFPETRLTDSQDVLEQRKREVESLEGRLKVLKAGEEAARFGLSLSRTPSNYDPSIWLKELDAKIEQENNKIEILEERLLTAQEELNQTKEDVRNKQLINIKSPQQGDGMLWNLMAYPGKLVKPGEVLGRVAVCDDLWVDAWVEESEAQTLKRDDGATMILRGLNEGGGAIKLEGKVQLIRSGVGRLETGSDVAVQIDANQAIHYAQVRIVSISIKHADNNPKDESSELCQYIGYSGKITFAKATVKSNGLTEWPSALAAWLQQFPSPGFK